MTGPPPPLPPNVEKRLNALLALYEDAQKRLNKQLESAALTTFQKWRLNELLAQVNKIMEALDAAARDTAGKATPKAYRQGIDLAAEAMSDAGMDVGSVSLGNKIHTASVQAIADQMAQDLVGANDSMKRYARRILMQTQQVLVDEAQLNSIIARGVVEGATRRSVSSVLRQELEKKLGEGVKVEVLGKDGKKRLYDPAYYAGLVARTRTREAVTEGTVRFAQEHKVHLFEFSVHDNPCPFCLSRQGKVYATTEGTGFPILDRRPPLHPHCKHVLVPYIPLDDEEEARLKAFSNSNKVTTDLVQYQDVMSGKSGGVELKKNGDPGNDTGGLASPPIWGKKTPEENVQTEKNRFAAAERLNLGRLEGRDIEKAREAIRAQAFESAFAWDANGKLIAARDGSVSRVDLFNSELQMASGGVILHNHPNGVTFSLDDLENAKTFGIKRSEIVAKGCDYFLEQPDRGWSMVSDNIWDTETVKLHERQEEVCKNLKYGKISQARAIDALHEAMKKFRLGVNIRYGRIEG